MKVEFEVFCELSVLLYDQRMQDVGCNVLSFYATRFYRWYKWVGQSLRINGVWMHHGYRLWWNVPFSCIKASVKIKEQKRIFKWRATIKLHFWYHQYSLPQKLLMDYTDLWQKVCTCALDYHLFKCPQINIYQQGNTLKKRALTTHWLHTKICSSEGFKDKSV